MNPITRIFTRPPVLISREKPTPEAQLNSSLLAIRGPALDAVDELLGRAVIEQWDNAGAATTDRECHAAVAAAGALTAFKAELAHRILRAEQERRRLESRAK